MSGDRIAFIGLGAMGEPMARRLIEAGYPLTVHNRSDRAAERLALLGANKSATARQAAADAEIVITILPDGPDVQRVAHAEQGLLRGLSPQTTWIEMSTIAPATARALAADAGARGARFIDAPVSGGTAGAKDGTLAIMVGGEERDLARVRPVLDHLGSQITLVGAIGAGQIAKAANQLIVGGTIGLVAEAFALAQALGVDAHRVREAVAGGFAGSRVLDVHGARMLDGTFEPGFRARLQRKDLSIVADSAHAAGLHLPLAGAALELFERACDAGNGELDHAVAIKVVQP